MLFILILKNLIKFSCSIFDTTLKQAKLATDMDVNNVSQRAKKDKNKI